MPIPVVHVIALRQPVTSLGVFFPAATREKLNKCTRIFGTNFRGGWWRRGGRGPENPFYWKCRFTTFPIGRRFLGNGHPNLSVYGRGELPPSYQCVLFFSLFVRFTRDFSSGFLSLKRTEGVWVSVPHPYFLNCWLFYDIWRRVLWPLKGRGGAGEGGMKT